MEPYRYRDFSCFTKKDVYRAEDRHSATLAVRHAVQKTLKQTSFPLSSRDGVSSMIPGSTDGPASSTRSELLAQVLPYKLNAMLSDPSISHIITWMPHGRAWKILRSKEFTEQVLPVYFNHPNYNSFIRLVNAWGFRRVMTGLDANAYFHELFLRDMPQLHEMMKRMTKNQKKNRLDQEDEPDFYKMKPVGGSTYPSMSNATSSTGMSHGQIQHEMRNHMANEHTSQQMNRATIIDGIIPAAGLTRATGNAMSIMPGGDIIIRSDPADANLLLNHGTVHADALHRNNDMTSLRARLRNQHAMTNLPLTPGPLFHPRGVVLHQQSGLFPSQDHVFEQNSLDNALLLAQAPGGLSPLLNDQRVLVDRQPHVPLSLKHHQQATSNLHLHNIHFLEQQMNVHDDAHQRELQLLLLRQQTLTSGDAEPLDSFVTGIGQGNSAAPRGQLYFQYPDPPQQYGEIASSLSSLPTNTLLREIAGRMQSGNLPNHLNDPDMCRNNVDPRRATGKR